MKILFMLKALFLLKIFKFLSCVHVGKQLDKKAKANFKIYDVTNWITTNLQFAYGPTSQEAKATRE